MGGGGGGGEFINNDQFVLYQIIEQDYISTHVVCSNIHEVSVMSVF